MKIPVAERNFSEEFIFRTSRSSGRGGQNVNKVSTRVELLFYVDASAELDDEEKKIITAKLKNRISKDGAIQLVCQEGRSQLYNKKKVIDRFLKILENALKPVKKRIPTTAGPESEESRKKEKIQHSRIKELRRKPGTTD